VSESYELWDLPRQHVGRSVRHFSSVSSTNDQAASLPDDPAHGGMVILADAQTAGRGQYGRTWSAPSGSSVLMSVLVFPPPELRRPAIMTAWAAVAVAETILELTGRQAKIKWPNDLLLQGRKVCGILIEQGRGTVAGIGLNLNQTGENFARAGLPLAGSLGMATGMTFDHREVAKTIIERLDAEYDLLLSGERSILEACWKWRLGLLGRDAVAECFSGEAHRGRVVDVSFDAVSIEQIGKSIVKLAPETVKSLSEV
jgi:BirA family transcriptional regulator, biotin operon repressor / biotin---[acetyl-CoA-carboxylase] ligase